MFKKGDKVLVKVGDSGDSKIFDGKICTIKEVKEGYVLIEEKAGGQSGIHFRELTLIEDENIKEVKVKKTKLLVGKLTRDEIVGQDDNKRMLKLAIAENMPVLLIGETGTGKTTIIRDQAQQQKADWLRFNLTGETTVDEFVGKYELEAGHTIWRDGILLQAMKAGKWLIVDEINVALPEILFVLHSLLDDDKFVVVASHSGEIVKPHKNFRFFATMNPCDEYAGTKELNKAFQSRFNMILELQYPDKTVETRIITDKAMIDSSFASKMADVAQVLRQAKAQDKIYYTCSTRDLIYWGNLVKAGLSLEEAFTVSVLNKAQADKPEIRDLYKNIIGKYIELEKKAGEPLSVEILEKKYDQLVTERKEFEDKKDKIIEQVTKDLVEKLTSKIKPDENVDTENLQF